MENLELIKTMHVPNDYSLNGWIYVLKNKFFSDDIYKVGMTTRTPEERAKELSTTGVPCEFDIVLAYATNNPYEDEAYFHNFLRKYRVNEGREFFKCDIGHIKNAAYECGLIERNEYVENIAVANEIIGLSTDEDYTEMNLYQSGISWYGNINSIRNYLTNIGLNYVINSIKDTGNSIVITNSGSCLIRNIVAQMEDENPNKLSPEQRAENAAKAPF